MTEQQTPLLTTESFPDMPELGFEAIGNEPSPEELKAHEDAIRIVELAGVVANETSVEADYSGVREANAGSLQAYIKEQDPNRSVDRNYPPIVRAKLKNTETGDILYAINTGVSGLCIPYIVRGKSIDGETKEELSRERFLANLRSMVRPFQRVTPPGVKQLRAEAEWLTLATSKLADIASAADIEAFGENAGFINTAMPTIDVPENPFTSSDELSGKTPEDTLAQAVTEKDHESTGK